jgi:hypothetical protein
MSFTQSIQNFGDSIAGATMNAPDEYPVWSSLTYETHMADLKNLWNEIRPQLKRDLEKAQWVDVTLQEMFHAFDAGQKVLGRKAAWALYNAEVTKLR